jgi:outer membrane protein OmpA-like peptidoglycan-associated protein
MIFCLIFSAVQLSWAQNKTIDVSGHADCQSMKDIQLRPVLGPFSAPEGHGAILEFSKNDKQDTLYMEEENHTVWYKFESKATGQLSFELIPIDSLNDYDFAVYKYTDENFCEGVINKEIQPIRTNFSRNKPEIASKTGLKESASKRFVGSGPNAAYSKALEVKKGEVYVLFINNVYANGEGHYLHFAYNGTAPQKEIVVQNPKVKDPTIREEPFPEIKKLKFSGKVIDDESQKAIVATISITDVETGNLIAETTSDSITGVYTLEIDRPASMNTDLQLEVYKDDYFFQDTVIKAYSVIRNMGSVRLDRKIKKLRKGDKFVVNNILFYGNSPKPLRRSMPTLKSLYKMMKRNKHLVIKIEGHTNGCSSGRKFSDELSDARAMTVVNFLKDYDIDAARMEYKGWGCRKMIYPENGPKSMYNRRVEISIIQF